MGDDNNMKKICLRCGSTWDSKKDNPHYCPRCKSPFWNKPKVRDSNKTETAEAVNNNHTEEGW
jgi:DNA-directed RNA polymerase subunit RPC12/RpoP